MAKQKKYRPYIIRARPVDQGGGAGNMYYASDATVTPSRRRAAKFVARGDADDFAKQHGIDLGGASYIDQEEFSDSEVE
jgi:hypothetical protein